MALMQAEQAGGAAGRDYDGRGQLFGKHAIELARLGFFQRGDPLVEQQHGRCIDQRAREADALLLAARERGRPLGLLVEAFGEMSEPGCGHGRAHLGILDRLGNERISQGLAQRAERKIRPLRQGQHARALRQPDRALAQPPDAGERLEQARLARPRRTAHQEPLARRKLEVRHARDRLAAGAVDIDAGHREIAPRRRRQIECARVGRVDLAHRLLEQRDAVEISLPLGDLGVGGAKRERALDPLERKRRLHQHAERNGADHVGGRDHQGRQHRRHVIVAEDKAVQPVLPENQVNPVAHQRGETPLELAALDRLATHQRDRLGMVGHARDGETEIGFAALLHEIERNERPADEMREHHAERGIAHRYNDQIAGERDIDTEQRQRRDRRNSPEDVGEREQRHDRRQQTGAELLGALDEQEDVAGDAQMDVVHALVDETDAVVAAFRHPQVDIMQRHPLAPADEQHLSEIILHHRGGDGAAGEEQEDHQLALQTAPVARLDRIEEAAVPLVDQHGEVDDAQLRADNA